MTFEEVIKFLETEYWQACRMTDSDIFAHLPTLRILAKQCKHVTEMGVRTGLSTTAFIAENVVLRSFDITEYDNVTHMFNVARSIGKDVQYIIANVLHVDIEQTDLLFIDTEHLYEQLSAELELHHNKVNKFIALHDTYAPWGLELMPAILEFLAKHQEWTVKSHTRECHGLTVLQRRQ